MIGILSIIIEYFLLYLLKNNRLSHAVDIGQPSMKKWQWLFIEMEEIDK